MTVKEDLEARIAKFSKLADQSWHYKNLAECGRRILSQMTEEEKNREIEEEVE